MSREQIKERTLKRAKNGKKGHKYVNAFRMLERASEPLNVSDLLPFCDRRTRLQHRVLLAAIEELEGRGLTLPAMRVEGGILLAGPLTYIHPRRLRTRPTCTGFSSVTCSSMCRSVSVGSIAHERKSHSPPARMVDRASS